MSIITKALEKAQEERSLKKTIPSPSVISSPKTEIVVTAAPQTKTSGKIGKNTTEKNGLLTPLLIVVTIAVILSIAAAIALSHSPSKSPVAPPRPAEMQVTKITPRADTPQDQPQSQPQTQSVVEKIRETVKNTGTTPIKPYLPSGDMPKLTGIMYTPSAPKAIMNDMVVSEGEKVGNFTVVEILPDKVKLSSEDKEFELKLR